MQGNGFMQAIRHGFGTPAGQLALALSDQIGPGQGARRLAQTGEASPAMIEIGYPAIRLDMADEQGKGIQNTARKAWHDTLSLLPFYDAAPLFPVGAAADTRDGIMKVSNQRMIKR